MLKSQNSIPIQCTSCRKFIFSFYKGFHWGQYCNSDFYTCGLNIVNSQKAFCKILLIIFFYQSQMCKKNPHICRITYLKEGTRLSWSWSYASWITTTYAISAYHQWSCEFKFRSGEVYSILHYVIKFVSDLRQVGGFLRVLRFPPSIKLTTTI